MYHRQAAAALFAAGGHGVHAGRPGRAGLCRDTTALLLVGAALIGLGSAIFHPEILARGAAASGGRFGLAQSLFQVGGNFGQAIGPLLAAFIVVPLGQTSIAWFSLAALIGIVDPVAGRRLVQPRIAGPTPTGRRQAARSPFARRTRRCGTGGAGGADLHQEHLHRQHRRATTPSMPIHKFGVSGAELAAHAVPVPRRVGGWA